MIQEQASEYALQQNNVDNFKTSNGLLDHFKSRHNNGDSKLLDDRASVNARTVDSWLERLLDITRDYSRVHTRAESGSNRVHTTISCEADPDRIRIDQSTSGGGFDPDSPSIRIEGRLIT